MKSHFISVKQSKTPGTVCLNMAWGWWTVSRVGFGPRVWIWVGKNHFRPRLQIRSALSQSSNWQALICILWPA